MSNQRRLPVGHDGPSLADEIRSKAASLEALHDDPQADEAELELLRDIRDAAVGLVEAAPAPARNYTPVLRLECPDCGMEVRFTATHDLWHTSGCISAEDGR